MIVNWMLLVSLALPVSNAAAPTRGLVIQHVNVVDVEAGELLGPRHVVLEGDRIAAILDVDQSIPEGYDAIDGAGRFLIPGLFDAHVHSMNGPDTYDPLFLAHGVTAIRDTGADTAIIMGLREQSREPDSMRPTVFCTGAIVDGDPPFWPFSEACDEPGEGVAAVHKLNAAGVDQIKVYSRLPPEIYREIIAEAHELGLRVTGHVPMAVRVEEALEAGQDCNEHLMGFPDALHRLAGREVDGDGSPLSLSWNVYPEVDREELRALLDNVAEAGMAQCPTLSVFRGYGELTPEGNRSHPQLDYVPLGTRTMWEQMASPAAQIMRDGLPYAIKLVGEMHEAGVTILAGTDLANPFVYAGHSLHDEIQYFQDAGMTPAEALRTATILPARFCDAEQDLGSVAVGRLASLVLLRENPLLDIAHTRSIDAVFLRGRYFDRAALDEMVEAIRVEVPADGAGEAVALDEGTGELLGRGTYDMKFEQFDAGEESFVARRTDDGGVQVTLDFQPQGGPQTPFELAVVVDDAHFFREARYRPVTATAPVVYTVKEEHLVVHEEGNPDPIQELALGVDCVVVPPGTAALGHALLSLGLGPGESGEYQLAGWGFMGNQAYLNDYQVSRLDDTTHGEGEDARAVLHFKTSQTVPFGEFQGEVWVTAEGLVVKSQIKMPFGVSTIELGSS